jgi:Tfp pilus assembly protein PilN
LKGVNLIPQPLRAARSRKRRLRLWTLACVVYAALLLLSCVVTHGLWSNQCHTVAADIASTGRRIDDANRDIAGRRAQRSAMLDVSRTTQAITDQPDWSVLLSALSASTEDDLIFREVRLGALFSGAVSRTVAVDPIEPRRYQLSLRGVSRSASSVAKFVSKLEQTQFFNDVKLLRTTRETLVNSPATGFEIECTFGPTRRGK